MRALILGGTGLLSRGVTTACLARGYEVVLFNRGRRPQPPGVRHFPGDRDCAADLASVAILRPDVVIDMLCFRESQATALVAAFGGRVTQLIFCSTACVYELTGLAARRRLPDESTPPTSRWHYGRGKAACEAIVLDAGRRGLFNTTIFRPSHVYGDEAVAHQLGTDGLRVLQRIERGLPVLVLDRGAAPWQACHASDAGLAFAAACLEPSCFGRIYNLAHREILSWLDMVRAFGRAVGREPQVRNLPSEALVRRGRPDLDEFALEIGRHGLAIDAARLHHELPEFRRTITLEDGLRRAWLRAPAVASLAYDADLELLAEPTTVTLALT
jgi:nucleoside-diphosphate-sugar epimerase